MGRFSPPGQASSQAVVLKLPTNEEIRFEAAAAAALFGSSAGDGAAFCQLYELTQAKLFSICLGICDDRSDAEDALTETYLTIWKHAAVWRAERGRALAWLSTIARYRAIDIRRRRNRRHSANLGETNGFIDPAPDAEALLLSAERHENLRQCIDKLTRKQREVICSAFLEGKTYAEVARINGVPHGTAKSWARRGLARLKTDMQAVNAIE